MTKFYLITETDRGGSHSWLSDRKEEPYERDGYSITSKEIKDEKITLDMIVNAVESEMEGANFHRDIFYPGWIRRILSKHLPEDKIREIFLDMIKDKGLLWEE